MPHKSHRDWMYHSNGDANRVEAFFSGFAYSPHRHDKFVIGMTIEGVQSFRYRGEDRHSLPGGIVILHPDETHDGRAGTEHGFRYRSAYVEPATIQAALGGKPLPFIAEGMSTDRRLSKAVARLLEGYDDTLDPLNLDDIMYEVAWSLEAISDQRKTKGSYNYRAIEIAKSYIDAHLDEQITMDQLEQISNHNRWELSRDFRALLGTSPYRYLVMRRLEKARRMLAEGNAIVETAIACSFSDQSHLTRHFKKTFGLTPKKWQDVLKAGSF